MSCHSRWRCCVFYACFLLSVFTLVTGFNVTTPLISISSPLPVSPIESFSFFESSSLHSTTSFRPTPTLLPPQDEVLVVKPNCFYLEATVINITIFNGRFENVSFSKLSRTHRHTDNVTGCEANKERNFTRYYYSLEDNKLVFWLTLLFMHDDSDSSWHLSIARWFNNTHNDLHIFDYSNCGGLIDAADDLSYFCNQVDCHGHEQLSSEISAELTLTNLRVDAFLKRESQPSDNISYCGYSDPNNNVAFLIVALVIGITLTLAVAIIIFSFIYKRYKYGRYNLLD